MAAIYLYAFPYFERLHNANELPRILTAQELAQRGTFRLDARLTELEQLTDVAQLPGGAAYQNKAPGVSMVGAVVYAPVAFAFHLFGSTPSLRLTTWLLRVFVVTLPSLLFLLLFRTVAERFAPGSASRDGALVAYALGSLAFPYSLLFMSHVPAAVAVGTAFERSIRLTRGEASSPLRSSLLIGALLGAALLVEYQAVFAALIVGGFAVLAVPGGARAKARVAMAVTMSAVPFVGALAAYHACAFGSVFHTGYTYDKSVVSRVGFMGMVGPSARSMAQLFTHAANGIAFVSPWTVLAVVGAVALLRNRTSRARVGREAIVAVLIVLAYFGFVASLEPDFNRGGWSVGPRYTAIAVPFLGWLAAGGLSALDGAAPASNLTPFRVAVRAVARGSIVVGVVVNVVAGTTFPHWPVTLTNPLFELSFRLLRDGHAPHSLGTAIGLHGLASLAPMYAAVAGLTFALLFRGRLRVEVALAFAFAALLLCADRYVPKTTKTDTFAETYGYVKGVWEPETR